jgi:predicted alpha/beta superfamily hydrolase
MIPPEPYPVPHGPDSASFRIHRFVSGVFGNVRYLRVYLPAGYDAPENASERYAVLYLSDGQTAFEAMPERDHATWRVEHAVTSLVRRGVIPPIIVVAIDNAGPQLRAHEYLPYPVPTLNPPEPAPVGRRYPDFLAREVVPFINMTYRTLADPSHTVLGGSSLGGLVAAFTMMAKPGVFGRYLIESPSFWVDDEHIFRDARYVDASQWPERVYLGVGTNERARRTCSAADQPDRMTRDVQEFAAMLRTSGMDSSRVKVVVTTCAMHNEDAWAARLPDALTFLFGK